MRSICEISLVVFITIQLNLHTQNLYANSLHIHNANESGILSGHVIDKDTKAGLSGATIYIPDLKIGAVADSAGNYHFNALPSGTYLVEARYVG